VVYILRSSAAIFSCVNSWCIWEEIVNDLESNAHRSIVCYNLLKFIFFLESNIVNTSFNGCSNSVRVKSAVVILSFIRITCFSIKSNVIVDVFKSLWRETSVASEIVKTSCAINKLLFRKQSSGGSLHSNGPMSFHGSSSWKGPATSTLSLILNSGYFVLFSPIYRFGQIIDIYRFSFIMRHCPFSGGTAVLCSHKVGLFVYFLLGVKCKFVNCSCEFFMRVAVVHLNIVSSLFE